VNRSILTHALAALAGFLLAYWIHKPVSIRETPAPAIALPSGGLVLERAPQAPVPEPVKVAAKEAKGKLERSVSVTVRPTVKESLTVEPSLKETAPALNTCACEDVTVDLGLLRMPDQTRRVVATARGGEILSAIDIPLEPLSMKRELRWAAGASVSFDETGRRRYGAFLDRDLGPFRLGVELGQRDGGLGATVRAGIRF